ncbi:MAG: hypothetical protein DHS20C02_13130 [Micavibrio sp.]|nr:MAG: hypothetical protein DHS20C02_13130 [Micavibrio sp.]
MLLGQNSILSGLGLLIMPLKSIQEKIALHRFVRLRQRHILTKNNKIRLRYTLGTASCLVAGLVTMMGSSGVSKAFVQLGAPTKPAALEAASESAALPLESHDVKQMTENFLTGFSSSFSEAALAIKAPPLPRERVVKLGTGDTVAGILQEAGVSGVDAYHAVKALSDHYDPRKVKPGQEIELRFEPAEDDALELAEIKMKIDPIKAVTVSKEGEEEFKAALEEKEVSAQPHASYAKIETSLYGSALKAGIPAPVIAKVIRAYSWNVDFQRDIRQGDKLEVLYEAYETDEGDVARYGEVLYASLSVGGKDIPIYRFKMDNGDTDYFEEDGRSVRKTLMKTPIDGARLSSGFGMRHHPILGYNKMHKGVDFAASIGTPIYAAGDGTVEIAGRKGGYGNYVRIRHNSSLKTAYAHLHKFAKGTRSGKRVKQGQVIAYVGTTGRSTGPHLHYEVMLDGKQVNPKRVDLPTGEKLKGKNMKRFKGLMASLKKQYVSLADGLKLAQRDEKNDKTFR